MGMPKPAMPARLKKGKLIDTVKGVVDTFNWTTDTVFNLTAKNGVEIFWADSSHPIIMGSSVGLSNGVKFTGTDYSTTSVDTPHFQLESDALDISCDMNFINYHLPPLPFYGTNNNTETSSDNYRSGYSFRSLPNSNVQVSCVEDKIYIGAYYI